MFNIKRTARNEQNATIVAGGFTNKMEAIAVARMAQAADDGIYFVVIPAK